VLLAQAKSEGELSLSLRSYADTAGPSGATRAPQAAALTRNVRVYRGGTPETVVTP
jgi:pilus assembly protein CpaB